MIIFNLNLFEIKNCTFEPTDYFSQWMRIVSFCDEGLIYMKEFVCFFISNIFESNARKKQSSMIVYQMIVSIVLFANFSFQKMCECLIERSW